MKRYNYVILNGSNTNPVLTFRLFTLNTRLGNRLIMPSQSLMLLVENAKEVVTEANVILSKLQVTKPFSQDPLIQSIKTKANNKVTALIETWIQEHPEEFL